MKIRTEEKHGIELRYWIVATILFSGVFGLMVLAFHDAADGYNAQNVTIPEIEERYDKLQDSASLVEGFKETTEGSGGFQLFNALGTLFTATIGVLSAVLTSLTFIPSITSSFASDFGIPTSVTNIFFLIVALVITTLVIFAILNAARR